ncbi:Sec-independent protein translocase protein (TatC) [Halomicrobium zhouii]|uniref:Sec-independent protein translocase protein (TatC) n=1 Tax=Halomicrobium zhouii TaxID=767519 RepID=A0A1I6M700_9EURY|nr:twin-arginine translocase subunit TatC [Halomicrobium zhouii]SFS11441.1 Sec-independent protein translocase protein (TatC) [Halomicrobium zhouii]
MTSSSSARQTADDRSSVRAVIVGTLGDPLAIVLGVVTFLAAVPVTVFAMQAVLWDVLQSSLNDAATVETHFRVTPFDVILAQVRVALVVGFVLALEAVVLRRWWASTSHAGSRRAFLALVGAALFPVGAVLGYQIAFPVAVEVLAAGDSTWSVVRWAGLACDVSLATGVATQVAFATGAAALSRSRNGSEFDDQS